MGIEANYDKNVIVPKEVKTTGTNGSNGINQAEVDNASLQSGLNGANKSESASNAQISGNQNFLFAGADQNKPTENPSQGETPKNGTVIGKDNSGHKTQTTYVNGNITSQVTFGADGKTPIKSEKNTFDSNGTKTGSEVSISADKENPATLEKAEYQPDGKTISSQQKSTYAANGKDIVSSQSVYYDSSGKITSQSTEENKPVIYNGKPVVLKNSAGVETNQPQMSYHRVDVSFNPDGSSVTKELSQGPKEVVTNKMIQLAYGKTANGQQAILNNTYSETKNDKNGNKISSKTISWDPTSPREKQIETTYNQEGQKTQESVSIGRKVVKDGEVIGFDSRGSSTFVFDYTTNGKPNSVKTDKNGKEIAQTISEYKPITVPKLEANAMVLSGKGGHVIVEVPHDAVLMVGDQKIEAYKVLQEPASGMRLAAKYDIKAGTKTVYETQVVTRQTDVKTNAGDWIRLYKAETQEVPIGTSKNPVVPASPEEQ